MLAAARRRPFLILLGALMVASAAWLIHYRVRLGFFLDDWQFVIGRHGEGIGNYLDPHQEHIVVIPVAIYKLFLNVFGMGTPMPLQIFSILVFRQVRGSTCTAGRGRARPRPSTCCAPGAWMP